MPGHHAIDQPGAGPSTDFRGSRRLVGAEEWFWYLAAGSTYIVLGIWHKWLLNWFVGPAWLVAFIVIGPWLTDRIGLTSGASSDVVDGDVVDGDVVDGDVVDGDVGGETGPS